MSVILRWKLTFSQGKADAPWCQQDLALGTLILHSIHYADIHRHRVAQGDVVDIIIACRKLRENKINWQTIDNCSCRDNFKETVKHFGTVAKCKVIKT